MNMIVKELSRELGVRLIVYPRLMASGKLTESECKRRMEALLVALQIVCELSAIRSPLWLSHWTTSWLSKYPQEPPDLQTQLAICMAELTKTRDAERLTAGNSELPL